MHTPDWLKLTSAALESSFDAILILEIQVPEATILYANRRAEELTGYTQQELLGLSPRMLESHHIGEQDLIQLAAAIRELKPYHGTARFMRKDGSIYWAELNLVPIDIEPQGRYWVSAHRDVTREMEATEALRKSEFLHRVIIENSPSLYRMYNREGRCVYASASSVRILGYTPEALLGLSRELLHSDDADVFPVQGFRDLWAGLKDFHQFEYRLQHKNGQMIWVSSTMRMIGSPDHPEDQLLLVVTEDISARKRAEQEAQEQTVRYTSLLDLKYRILQASQPSEVTGQAIELALPLTEYEFGMFISFQGDQLRLEGFHGADREHLEPLLQQLVARNTRATILQLLQGTEPVFISADQTRVGRLEIPIRKTFRTFAVLPIHAEGEIFGAISFAHREAVQVSESTKRLLSAIEERVSLAYSKLIGFQRLEESREETMRTLGLALEYRDYETKGHTDRVIDLCDRLGQGLGLDEDTLKELRWGAYLHDIGKISTPDAVLLKPGKLNPEEWDVIKQHPVVGYELTRAIPSLPERTLDIVLYHQERWNGSGYPEGRRGEEIPFLARVFAVVDVYDALTSERPYKRAFSHEEAVAQLLKESGTLLDPEIVRVFLGVMGAGPGFDP
ncbi:HD domain-containing phosphohydrolase [Deinococcus cellulosilyticus]|uniref:Uncharacterized protein n=1 Tax=Deinococcus cellulosilyticus (strain DSM 18568 / NBRC 106333 / KACC 11606 / 5516J-15) TaxID=1223518 RepID=A0A511MVS3_DEIC1|nr:HD domain-containing phosphohydrolase [Deinococcus cellulosilyticus]GEM44660.1 hypothetical protein DC3_02950 [Deinococcus cellulosilyticus NBRC 106333 = KACC 11606]